VRIGEGCEIKEPPFQRRARAMIYRNEEALYAPAEDPAAARSPRVLGGTMAPAELEGALQTASEIELTVTGRRSGRDISNPVWFVQEGRKAVPPPGRRVGQ
jgi:hypothetical protein